MKQFIAIVHKDADSAFGISFPDLPGCFSAADVEADIQANAADALALWCEDQNNDSLPSPTTLHVLTRQFADELQDGAYLVPVSFEARL